jgi:hypothetical protein
MQLVVPIAVTAADAAAIKILSRISPHDVFFILLHSLICQFVHRDTKTQSLNVLNSSLCLFTADFSDLKVQRNLRNLR